MRGKKEEQEQLPGGQQDKTEEGKAAPVAAAASEVDYEKLSDMVASKMIILMKTPEVADTRNMGVESPRDIHLKDGDLAVGGAIIDPTGKGINKSYLDELAFMEEEMVVTVAETSDENAENPVIVGNNGQFCMFFRGVPKIAKRRFVSELIVKTGRVTTPEIQVPGVKGGTERSFSIVQKNAHKYPFTVNRDDNPKGRDWLMARMNDQI